MNEKNLLQAFLSNLKGSFGCAANGLYKVLCKNSYLVNLILGLHLRAPETIVAGSQCSTLHITGFRAGHDGYIVDPRPPW